MDRPLVVEAEPIHPEAREWLAERADLVGCEQLEQPRFDELLARAEGLIVRSYTRVDHAVLASAPRLRVVGRAGVGLDRIDLEACRQRAVTVVHTPDANAAAVVEFVFASILDAVRPRLFLERPLQREHWDRVRDELVGRRELAEMTLGVYGFGRIGARVAHVGAAFGMKVVYTDLRDIPEPERGGALPMEPGELLAGADVITLHVDGRPGNHGLLGAQAFALMRPDAVLVNTSRGHVVDAFALAEFMLAHPGAAAVLDVHDPEPFDATYPLLDIENVHLAPHIAGATAGAKLRMSWVVRDVWRVLRGEAPHHPAPRNPGGIDA